MEKFERPRISVYRPPGRPGVDQTLVEATANRLLEQGERPTVNRIRKEIGGSPNTIAPMLDEWWRRLGQRVHSKVPSALDRLPGQLGLIAEAFFAEALEQARIRAKAELSKDREDVEQRRQDTEVRSHLLSLREKEFSALVQSHAKRVEELEAEIRDHIIFERKLLSAKDALEKRVQELLEQLAKHERASKRKEARRRHSHTKQTVKGRKPRRSAKTKKSARTRTSARGAQTRGSHSRR